MKAGERPPSTSCCRPHGRGSRTAGGSEEVAHAPSLPPPTTEIVGAIIVNVRLQALITTG